MSTVAKNAFSGAHVGENPDSNNYLLWDCSMLKFLTMGDTDASLILIKTKWWWWWGNTCNAFTIGLACVLIRSIVFPRLET